ncbi:MAG: hypothetical protein IKL68_00855 [Clostridia bacterium]|nr:hypothetical protein [Clostridia bacterium]
MDKSEILKYAEENYELPPIPEEYLTDMDFVADILDIDSMFMESFPLEVQKKVIILDEKYAEYADIDGIFVSEEVIKDCIGKNPDLLLRLKGSKVQSDFLKEQFNGYIRGEIIPEEGSRLSKAGPGAIYGMAPKYVADDIELATYLVEKDINNYKRIRIPEIRDSKEYMAAYVTANPREFLSFKDKLDGYFKEELVEAVIKQNFANYKQFPESNSTMQRFYSSYERIKRIRPELTLENPNLRYELLCDEKISNMDINTINSLLEYSTGAVDTVIEVSKTGNLEALEAYIEKYKGVYGETLPSIQGAISSYLNLSELVNSTNGLDGINIPEDMFKTLVATGNKFGIKSIEDLANYEEKVREYYDNQLDEATTPDEVRKIYSEMLFNASPEEMQAFDEEYCNFNMEELYEYAKAHNVEAPITDEFKRRLTLFEQMTGIDNIDKLRAQFGAMPTVISDVSETKQRISSMYSKTYNQEMLDLTDETLDRESIDGVEIIKLNGQSFNLCIHRIFNFDFNMNSIANRIIEDPTTWSKTEGSNTISTTLITDKKIAGLFRSMKTRDGAELVTLKDEAAAKAYAEAGHAADLAVYEGEVLKEIDPDAVFYGFTELAEDGIIKMDSTDMMVEHGAGHMDTKSMNCRMRGTEDLAYWTDPTYWNEIVQKRKETDISKAKDMRSKTGTDKLMPSCIVCFDGNMNENAMRAAKAHNIPIVMIDRQQYLDLNTERANEARKEFKETLSPDAIREIMYREPYYKVVAEMPSLIETITTNENLPEGKKKLALEYLGYMAEHFVEQSTGHIMGTPVEEYNKTMREHIESIDRLKAGPELVSMEDFESSYRETTARDRKERYEAMLKDMEMERTKEGEIVYE